ncbi:MAG: hypothetical protein ACJA0U_000386 [Salibacteraceae bacterium]|jgi:hypothetical protein
MKNMKTLLMSICLFAGFNSFSQEVKNTSSDIVYKGTMYYVDKSLTDLDGWIESDKQMLERMTLITMIYSAENSVLWDDQKDLVKEGDLLLGIPYMSCGIIYEYYKLIQTADNFLLFQEIGYPGDSARKVIVLNKRM